jgi:hypothetical protein
MKTRRLLTVLVAGFVAMGVAACDDDDATTPEGGEEYALQVDELTDAVSGEVADALTTLNRLADEGITGEAAGERLDDASGAVHDAAADLPALSPPEAASGSAADLGAALSDLGRALDSAAIDARATERGISTPGDVGRAQARVVLAYGSGVAGLSRAVGGLAVAPAPSS